MPLVSLDDLRTRRLICTYHVTPVFWVELARKFGRVHQVTEHHGELATFSFWSRRLGGSRFSWSRLVWLECFLLSQLRGSRCRLCCGFANPNKSFAVVIDNRMHV